MLWYSTCNPIICYLISNGIKYRNGSSTIVYAEGFGFVFVYLLYYLITSILNKRQHGQIWSKDRSAFLKKDGGINYVNLLGMLIRVLFQGLALINMGLMSYYSKKAGISTTTSKSTSTQVNESSEISVLIPILLALGQCILFTGTALTVRIVSKQGYSTLQFSFDIGLLLGIFYIGMFIYEHYNVQPYQFSDVIYFFVAAFILILSIMTQNYALKMGKGGLASAIVQTQCFFQLLIEITFDKKIPNLMQIIALICGILGAVTIALAKN
ncbi:UNKNOWN [Stylonychia lemnae]|uniref:EamA domain-containing protein n=1 Tax=Stylonychia lemnae TaxID=5949 RepID=A0A077ZZ40_STYLE|nr:UNKNOWN [Stylonychia lemnae]|eukprot:CDW75190.1 UNKNOWN [Stylonychia lemnae]